MIRERWEHRETLNLSPRREAMPRFAYTYKNGAICQPLKCSTEQKQHSGDNLWSQNSKFTQPSHSAATRGHLKKASPRPLHFEGRDFGHLSRPLEGGHHVLEGVLASVDELHLKGDNQLCKLPPPKCTITSTPQLLLDASVKKCYKIKPSITKPI